MKILIANLGSTSLKYRLFDFANGEQMLARGGFERVTDYAQAIDNCLTDLKKGGWIQTDKDLAAVGFKTVLARGVNGCVRLTEDVIRAMEAYNDIAPAHNIPYVTGARLFAKRVPNTPLIGLFETAFYQWAPEAAMRYGVPESWYQAGVRRWGFHGASHKFIAERSAELLGRDDVADRARQLYVNSGNEVVRVPLASETAASGSGSTHTPALRVISCHLGGSSSITGIHNGVAIGNSMGLSPQSGLPHNNRVGDLDAMAVPFMMRTAKLSLDEVERQLCKEAGLKGLSGGASNDIRDIQAQAAQGNQAAALAIDVFVHNARHWIGSYFLQLNGMDALVFTAGIGENRAEIRQAICADLDQLGIVLEPALNDKVRAQEGVISASHSRVRVMVIPTNEELVVAREVKRFLNSQL
jgi:acetate kinase